MNSSNEKCTLCGSELVLPYHEDNRKRYLQCSECSLIFVPKIFWVGMEEEKEVYDRHENSPEDSGYRKFLSQITNPLLEKLSPHMKGLDFGCGPGPTLSVIMKENGYSMDLYDPWYQNHPSLLQNKYDYICATEVIEHLHNPMKELSTLFKMLKPGGILALMTRIVYDKEAFTKWNYIRDITHICFYPEKTFKYIAKKFNVSISFPVKDVIFLQKKSTSGTKK